VRHSLKNLQALCQSHFVVAQKTPQARVHQVHLKVAVLPAQQVVLGYCRSIFELERVVGAQLVAAHTPCIANQKIKPNKTCSDQNVRHDAAPLVVHLDVRAAVPATQDFQLAIGRHLAVQLHGMAAKIYNVPKRTPSQSAHQAPRHFCVVQSRIALCNPTYHNSKKKDCANKL
jgi:hypothetical protein